jgi:2-amino-4-hydroxy-6-hydroxymethyldihydropteridine diphosphokinase
LTRAFLGLGSNLGDRWQHLRDAVTSLKSAGLIAVSPVYETEPMGGPSGQDRYLNLVVELDTQLTARQLLAMARRLEAAAGRVRAERWGSRPLDVDILWVGGEAVNDPDLQVPHPRMWQRRFVMAPLADLAPDLVPADLEERSEGRVELVGPLNED